MIKIVYIIYIQNILNILKFKYYILHMIFIT